MRIVIVAPWALAVVAVAFGWPRGRSESAVSAAPAPTAAPAVHAPDRAKQYADAITDYYLPAKHRAEETGNWFPAYEVARAITSTCTLRDEWNPMDAGTAMDEPAQLPGMAIDWRDKTITAARETTSCIQVVRSEAR